MRFLTILAATLLFTSAAGAHSGDHSAAGHAHDFLHAVGGPDHVIALVSVGLIFLLIAIAPFLGRKLARSFEGLKARLFGRDSAGDR